MHRRHQIESRGVDVAGLDAVDALDLSEQVIVVGDRLATEGERADREIFVIAREAFLDGAAERGLVARGGDLVVVGQAGGVLVDGVIHAERLRPARHQPGEIVLTARDRLRNHDGGVVGRTRDHALDRVFDRERASGLETKLGRRLSGGFGGDLERRVELEFAGVLEQQIEGHDLGERCRMSLRVGIGRMQHIAGIGIDHDVRVGRGKRAIARYRENSSNKTEHTPTKPVMGSGPDPQHDISPVPRSPSRSVRSADTPVVPR